MEALQHVLFHLLSFEELTTNFASEPFLGLLVLKS